METPDIINSIRSAGCDVGWMTILNRSGQESQCTGISTAAYAVCKLTGEFWCVVADQDAQAWPELARLIAITQTETLEPLPQE